MRYDKEHKARTRQRLLDEAASAILVEGPERLGVAALMARLGLTHGGFYAHFRSKEDLVRQAIATSFDKSRAEFEAAAKDRPAAEVLEAYIDRYLSMAHVDREGGGCPLPRLSGDLPRMEEGSRADFAAGMARVTGLVASLLRQTGTAEADAPDMATSAVAEMAGAVALARASGDRARAEAILASSKRAVKARLGLG